ncbi:hypothetical protein OSJ00_21710, partial [Mycobacterium ulcerans]
DTPGPIRPLTPLPRQSLDDRGLVTESMSRADVVTEMNKVAQFVRQDCGLAPGDRAVLVYPPGLDFVCGLLGAWRPG